MLPEKAGSSGMITTTCVEGKMAKMSGNSTIYSEMHLEILSFPCSSDNPVGQSPSNLVGHDITFVRRGDAGGRISLEEEKQGEA